MSGTDLRLLNTAELLGRSFGLYVMGAIRKLVRKEDVVALVRTCDPSRTSVPQRRTDPITEGDLLEGLDGSALTIACQPRVEMVRRAVVGVAAWGPDG